MEDILNKIFLGNTVQAYLIAAGILIVGVIFVHIFKKIILGRLKKWAAKTKTTLDDFIILGVQKTLVPILYFSVLYFALTSLTLPPQVVNILNIALIVVITFYAIKWTTTLMDYSFAEYTKRKTGEEQKTKQLNTLGTLGKTIIWIIGLIFLLDNLGINISAVVAGLGIGGIAVALAAQTILGDLFSYFIIFFDRPFEIGDYVQVGDKSGTIEHIGIKTTRLRALHGEEVVFSNTDLTNSRLHNFKKLRRRRIVFELGVIYETSPEKLNMIPGLVKQIIDEQENAEFNRGHFKAFGDFSLNFEFVFYVLSQDYKAYMDVQQSINYKIFNRFSDKGIEFAYPTQVVYMNKVEPTAA